MNSGEANPFCSVDTSDARVTEGVGRSEETYSLGAKEKAISVETEACAFAERKSHNRSARHGIYTPLLSAGSGSKGGEHPHLLFLSAEVVAHEGYGYFVVGFGSESEDVALLNH